MLPPLGFSEAEKCIYMIALKGQQLAYPPLFHWPQRTISHTEDFTYVFFSLFDKNSGKVPIVTVIVYSLHQIYSV